MAAFSKDSHEKNLAKFNGLSDQLVKASFQYYLESEHTQWEETSLCDPMRNLLVALRFSVLRKFKFCLVIFLVYSYRNK